MDSPDDLRDPGGKTRAILFYVAWGLVAVFVCAGLMGLM